MAVGRKAAPTFAAAAVNGSRRLCNACRMQNRSDKLVGTRPVAAHCPGGCAGCVGW